MPSLLRFKVFIASLRLFSGNHSFKTNISAPLSAGASRLKGLSIYEHSVSFPYGCLVRPEYCGRSWLAGDTYALATALRLLGFGKKKRRSVRFRSLPAQAPPLLGGSRSPHSAYLLAGGRRLRRKPRESLLRAGTYLSRRAERTMYAELCQEPPRKTRKEPSAGPTGSVAATVG